MENQENILDTELLETLGDIIYDIFFISREIRWIGKPAKKVIEKKLLEKFKENYKRTKNYFTYNQVRFSGSLLLGGLENLLGKLEKISFEIKDFPDEKKEKIVSFIKLRLYKLSKIASFSLNQNFRDMIFIELGLDHIDDIGEAKDETSMLLNKIMMMK